jgi:hypothetical protein
MEKAKAGRTGQHRRRQKDRRRTGQAGIRYQAEEHNEAAGDANQAQRHVHECEGVHSKEHCDHPRFDSALRTALKSRYLGRQPNGSAGFRQAPAPATQAGGALLPQKLAFRPMTAYDLSIFDHSPVRDSRARLNCLKAVKWLIGDAVGGT